MKNDISTKKLIIMEMIIVALFTMINLIFVEINIRVNNCHSYTTRIVKNLDKE